jgi:hypothetical protein
LPLKGPKGVFVRLRRRSTQDHTADQFFLRPDLSRQIFAALIVLSRHPVTTDKVTLCSSRMRHPLAVATKPEGPLATQPSLSSTVTIDCRLGAKSAHGRSANDFNTASLFADMQNPREVTSGLDDRHGGAPLKNCDCALRE